MADKIKLSITDPCHEDWRNMIPAEKGRFCASCEKHVVDFTGMSDREIAQFFKKTSTGQVCGRFKQDQLNRELELPKKRLPWVKYFFQIAIPTFLASGKLTAQGEVRKIIGDTLIVNRLLPEKIIVPPIPSNVNQLKGKVVDENGNPVYEAVVQIKGTKQGVVTDEVGNFVLDVPGDSSGNLIIDAVGHEVSELLIDNKSCLEVPITIVLKRYSEELVGFVVATAKRFGAEKVQEEMPLIRLNMDSSEHPYKVYPNPAKTGSEIHLEWKSKEEGYYIIELFNLSGKQMYRQASWIDAEAKVINMALLPLGAGVYFIRLTNRRSGKRSTEKIIIE